MTRTLIVGTIVICAICFGLGLWVGFEQPTNSLPGDTPAALDPRAPPADVDDGSYSYTRQHEEHWRKVPVSRKSSTTDRTDETDQTERDKIIDYGSKPSLGARPVCDATSRAPARAFSPPATPPAPSWIGERAPFWYETEGRYRAPDSETPPNEPERPGLFARLRERRSR